MSPMLLRLFGGALVVGAVATLSVAAPEMVSRLRERRDQSPLVRWATKPVADEAFSYRGDPVRVATTLGDSGGSVDVVWRGHTERLPITGRDDPRLPGLLRHNDWLRVLEIVQVRGLQTPESALASGDSESRLVVVARAPAPGYDPDTWGQVREKEWSYTFVELLPDGTMRRSSMPLGEIEPRTWQDAVALQVTPELQRNAALQLTSTTLHPGRREGVDESFRALGWTWTAAGLAVLAGVVGAAMFGASFISRRAPQA